MFALHVSPAMNRQHVMASFDDAGIGSSPTATLNRISGRKWMDGDKGMTERTSAERIILGLVLARGQQLVFYVTVAHRMFFFLLKASTAFNITVDKIVLECLCRPTSINRSIV